MRISFFRNAVAALSASVPLAVKSNRISLPTINKGAVHTCCSQSQGSEGWTSPHLNSADVQRTPIHFYVLSWVLLVPILFFATNSSPSLLSETNSTLMTNDNVLLKMNSGPRPQVLIDYMFMFGLMVVGRTEIIRAATKNKFLVLSGVALAMISASWSENAPALTCATRWTLHSQSGLPAI